MKTGSIILITIFLLIAYHEVPAAELTVKNSELGLECPEGPKGHRCRGKALMAKVAECDKPCTVTVILASGTKIVNQLR